jgi:hypothetical protein
MIISKMWFWTQIRPLDHALITVLKKGKASGFQRTVSACLITILQWLIASGLLTKNSSIHQYAWRGAGEIPVFHDATIFVEGAKRLQDLIDWALS